MAALTHSTVKQNSVGNLTLSVISFTDIDNADTYNSGIPSVVGWWINATDAPTTQSFEKIDVKYDEDIPGSKVGRFTFYTAETSRTGDLYILSRT